MKITLDIEDSLWTFALAQSALDGVDPLARATQYVNEYCTQCGKQLGLSADARLAAILPKLSEADKQELAIAAAAKVSP